MSVDSTTVRIFRVFVSSPRDVQPQRDVLSEVLESINTTDGRVHGFRLELFRWERDVAPQIGPRPQAVIDSQLPPCEIYLGIMSARFGTPAGRYGSGTEQEFRQALKQWRDTGRPWLLFYFDAAPALPTTLDDIDQYRAVVEFRGKLEALGIMGTFSGLEGRDGFRQRAADHLRTIVQRLRNEPAPTPPPPDVKEYLRDLAARTGYIEIRGVRVGQGRANRFPIEDLFISLTTTSPGSGRTDAPAAEPGAVALHVALRHDRLVVVGDPGSGKTTFLRRVAHPTSSASGSKPANARCCWTAWTKPPNAASASG